MTRTFAVDIFKIFVVINFIILEQSNVTGQSTTVNCSKENIPPENLPTVLVYDTKDEEQDRDNNGTVILEPPIDDKTTKGWIGLECSHNKPVKWAFDLNFFQSGLGDSYSATFRDVEDFYNSGTYTFRADVEIKIQSIKGLNFVLACATFENMCERTVVQAYYSKTHKRYVLRKLSKFEERQPLVTELDRALAKSRDRDRNKFDTNSTCDVNFALVDHGHYYIFGFNPPGGMLIHPRSVPDRQTLENVYFYTDHLDPSCVLDKCDDEKYCHSLQKRTTKWYLPTVFYMFENNVSRVVHVYHTLTTEKYSENDTSKLDNGTLKFSWEPSSMKNMMRIELPTQLHIGEKIRIECHLSPFYFSFGSLIGYKFENDYNITFIDKESITEDVEVGDDRVAMALTDFQIEDNKEVNVTVFCFSPIWNSSTEWANISETVVLKPSKIKAMGYGDRKLYYYPLNHTFNASCSAEGPPVPSLEVVLPENSTRVEITKTVDNGTIHANIRIINLDESHVGFYNCIAVNYAGLEYYSFEVQIKKPDNHGVSSTLVTILISVFGSVTMIFLLVVIILAVRFRMEKEEFRRLTEEAVRDFFDGEDASHIPQKDADEALHYANDSIKTLPYNRKFEVPFRQWSIYNTILGSGSFAVVRRGQVEMGARKCVVAVKMVKTSEDIDDFRATLLELKIMAHIGHHRHIVKLVAASTEEIVKRNVFIGVEFCANGNLLTYLQKRKKLFNNLVKDGQIHFPEKIKEQPEEEEEDSEGQYKNLVTSDISTVDLYKWSFQIASGMEFLESKKVLHADLAARNILLTEELEVKISDFGLSRDLFTNSEYTKKTQVALPWKWLAIESLKFLKFSTASDVWSYGVTLFEVFSLGEEPYSGMTWNEEFITTLETGMRLDRPAFCTQNMYTEVMWKCWQMEPKDRIRFSDVMSFFEQAIGLLTSSPRKNDECRDFC